jgi:DNA-directed RNA polymerase specialized sigma24 family protein
MTKTRENRTGGKHAAKKNRKNRNPPGKRVARTLGSAKAEEFAAGVAGPPVVAPPGPADTPHPTGTAGPAGPAAAFDQLYARYARTLIRQAFLLTGARTTAESAVTRAFHSAWERWPEVATDRDPAGWVRAAAHERALSPWNRLRPGHRMPDAPAGPPEDRLLLDALLRLPGVYRRPLLLHDGAGLGIAETAAETEAGVPATAGRVAHARDTLASLLPEVGDAAPEEYGKVIGALLGRAAAAYPVRTVPARDVRAGSERATRRRTVAAYGLAGAVVAASAFTIATTEQGDLLPRTPLSYVQELSAD